MNPKVDFYFKGKWQKELEQLRTIILDAKTMGYELTEELKWGTPCYAFNKSNILLMHVFKEYCALLFFKGALLKDTKGILVQQTANVQAARQIRFTHVNEIVKLKTTLKTYIKEAVEIEKAGLKVELKKTSQFTMPKEFKMKLDKDPLLKKAFNALTPGRQRGYLLHFSQPKQEKTRESRIEKCTPQILKGMGLND